MFTLPISDILSSYTGDSKKFSFSGEIFDWYMEDIIFQAPLDFSIQIIALDDWVEVVFYNLSTVVLYEEKIHTVKIVDFARTWKKSIDTMMDDDDVGLIDAKSWTIDLTPVLREEIIMACH